MPRASTRGPSPASPCPSGSPTRVTRGWCSSPPRPRSPSGCGSGPRSSSSPPTTPSRRPSTWRRSIGCRSGGSPWASAWAVGSTTTEPSTATSPAAGPAWTNRSPRCARIWAGEAPFEGADPVGPPPVQAGGPPLVAGVMGPKALARAAQAGPSASTTDRRCSASTPTATSAAFDRIRSAWTRRRPRTDAPHISASLWYALGDGAADRLSGYCFDYMRIFDEGFARSMAETVTCNTPAALASSGRHVRRAGLRRALPRAHHGRRHRARPHPRRPRALTPRSDPSL